MAQAMTDVEGSRCDLWTAQKDDRPHIRPESIDSGHLLPREKAFLRNLYPPTSRGRTPPACPNGLPPPSKREARRHRKPSQTEIPTPGGKFFRRGSNIR